MYLQLKTVVHEILEAETEIGGAIDGYKIIDNFEEFYDEGKFIHLEYGPAASINFGNSGNLWSLMQTQMTIVIYETQNAIEGEVDELRAIVEEVAWIVRRIFKNNHRLISASAPDGYAQKTLVDSVQMGRLNLPDGTPRTVARFELTAWHMKNEAA